MCGECRARSSAEYRRRKYEQDPEWYSQRYRSMVKPWKQRTRAEALEAYGAKCACCGEAEDAFLVIDHIDGGGGEHRKELGRGAYLIYIWLKRNGWPPGFQVLCANCNTAKERPGGCPHRTSRNERNLD